MSEETTPRTTDETLLTIKERINYPYLLAEKLRNVDRAITGKETDIELTEAIELVHSSIPDFYKDDDFKNDIKASIIEVEIDNRPIWCGRRMSPEFCRRNGIEPFTKSKDYDPFKVHQAIINLLQRIGMIGKTRWKEIATGQELEITEEDILGDLEE